MVWNPEQAGAFLDFALPDRLYALWHLIAYRGLRRAEALGVAWTDVDLDAGTLTIRETLVDAADDEWENPKSRASERTIALDAATVTTLRTWREQQERERSSWGDEWVDSGRVFTKENGEPLNPDSVSQRFDRLIVRTGQALTQCSGIVRSGARCERTAPDGAACHLHGGQKKRRNKDTARSGLPPIRLHDLRHTAASLVYRQCHLA